MLFAPSTHPETYGKLLARSFNLYKNALWRTYILALLFAVMIFVPRLKAAALGQALPAALSLSMPLSDYLLWIAVYLISLWLFAAIYWRIHCVAIKKHESFVEDFKTAFKKTLYLIGAGIIIFLIGYVLSWFVILSYVLLKYFNILLLQQTFWGKFFIFCGLFIPVWVAFYVGMLFIFYFPLIVLENDRTFLALSQSVLLVWGNVWRVISVQLTPWVVYIVALLLMKIVFQLSVYVYFLPAAGQPSWLVIILEIIALTFFIPWSIAAMIVQLQDLELRKAVTGSK